MANENGVLVLSQGVGYGIVVGIGAFFALMMLAITYLQNRYTTYSTKQSEEFNTASRSVKPGLIAAGIVSSWTWSSTLLTSSTFAYSYGIGGPMWYAAMGSSQILLFSLIAIKIKTNAPGAHTFPEIILAHHGRLNHLTYLFFAFATNLLVGSCLVLGGSQVVGALSGVNVYGACFLIPLVVAAYVIAGGLRSTFIADYAHTVILFVAILTFGFSMYATSPTVGSIGKFYDLLLEAGRDMPIPGNAHNGSYLTFKSDDGLVFAIDLLVAGFCTVWLDQAYWQRAIASRPETSVKAYLFGGIAWYGIPFGFATAMGLGCAALTSSPSFPTYPNPLSAAQNGSGLSAPAAAIALLGSGGAGLLLLLLFMAVTSATSAELIAVSSLITFDLYKTYIKPTASSDELVRMSHYGIIIFSVILASFCCILNAVSINLTWVLTVLGVIVGGASIPVGLILLWEPMSSVAALISPWIGTALGLVAWFVVTKLRSGSISVETTGDVTNAVAGNVTSCCTGVIMAFVLTYLSPSKWGSAEANGDLLAKIRLDKILQGIPTNSAPDTAVVDNRAGSDLEKAVKGPTVPEEENSDQPASDPAPETVVPTGNAIVDFLEASYSQPMNAQQAQVATRLAYGFNIAYWAIAMILVPFAFFGTEWEFTRAGFMGCELPQGGARNEVTAGGSGGGPYTLLIFPFSLYSIMARFAIELGKEYHQGPNGVPNISHRLIDLHRDENLEEWFLTEINPTGQVPVMTREWDNRSTKPRLEVTTESVVISKFFGEHFFPGLLGGARAGEVDRLLAKIHEIQAFSLSIKSPTKEQAVEVPDPGQDERLARTNISDKYRRALEYKRVHYYDNLAYALRPENIQKAKAQAADLFQQLLLIYREHHSIPATEQEQDQAIWLFGATTGPTVLDAHAVALIARIDDAGQEELVPGDLLAYARKARSLPAWEAVTHGRKTIWNRSYGHVYLLKDL